MYALCLQGVIELPYKLLIGPLLWPQWQGPTFPNSTGPQPNPNAIEHCELVFAHRDVAALKLYTLLSGADPAGTMFPKGTGCLFNVEDDPSEETNLAGDPKHADTVTRLRSLIAEAQVC